MRQSTLSKSLTVSLLLHAGILGALLLVARTPMLPERPLRVRIVEPPPAGPSAPPAAPRPLPPPGRDRVPTERVERTRPIEPDRPAPALRSGSSEPGNRGSRAGGPEGAGTLPTARSSPALPAPSPPSQAATPPSPPPQIASRTVPEVSPPTVEPRREFRQEAPPPPDRSGLTLGGPRDALAPRAPTGPADKATKRPSIRDQIASLGSGLIGDTGETAKQTIPLDSREPRYLNYLARLKARIQAEWDYPEEARRVGLGGELNLLFTLNKAGTLVNIRLVESSGYPVLDNEALRAVKAAAPFDPFPPQMGNESWNILATFHYHSQRR
jgi:periplasmic protein TonB